MPNMFVFKWWKLSSCEWFGFLPSPDHFVKNVYRIQNVTSENITSACLILIKNMVFR